MRTKRNQKIPKNFEDFVHNINTTKTNSKKTASKKSGGSLENQKVNCKEKGVNGECSSYGNTENGECGGEMRDKGEEHNVNEGFIGDLNGEQFPLTNGYVRNMNDAFDKIQLDSTITDFINACLEKGMNCAESVVNLSESIKVVNNEVEEMEIKKACDRKTDNMVNIVNTTDAREGKKLVDIMNASKLDNKLLKIPTEVSENGNEVVVFDYELIELSSNKWNLTVCGQFIRCSMSFNRARYHLKRMWNIFGLWDIIAHNDIFLFKFQDDEEIKEAWSVKGISALSSSLGKQVIMDEVTTRMCLTGVGRIGFSIVLVEIGADEEIKDKIKIIYKSKNVTKGTKKISVNGFKVVQNRKIENEGFDQNRKIHVQNRYNGRMWNAGRYSKENNKRQTKSRFDYRKIIEGEKTDNEIGGKGNKMDDNIGRNTKHNEENVGKTKMLEAKNNNISVVKGKMKESLDKSNRFTLLDSLVYEDELVPDLNEIKIVDKKEIIDAMDYMSSDDVVEEVNVEGNICLRNEVDEGRAYAEAIRLMNVLQSRVPTHLRVNSLPFNHYPSQGV
ncbi:hypothetical protein Tco_1393149 [Tanacetum coccineum]